MFLSWEHKGRCSCLRSTGGRCSCSGSTEGRVFLIWEHRRRCSCSGSTERRVFLSWEHGGWGGRVFLSWEHRGVPVLGAWGGGGGYLRLDPKGHADILPSIGQENNNSTKEKRSHKYFHLFFFFLSFFNRLIVA